MDKLEREVADLTARVDSIEDEHDALARIPELVGELKGQVETLQTLVIAKLDGVHARVDKATSIKTALEFAAVVVIPVIVALIGGYFALRAGLVAHAK